ncbi:LysR family transcriptional regulator [Mesorhizobium sp. 1M-11]|uniref:LysR family transcriptional regulator n=1 Tax=Mesorhizobium sp. 1M-11 TaxID=1529006 RepID=UPI0006C754BE|nr:LysR family transcriptional regulator [Mesorhizobium sp. 1M-11]
MDRLLSMEVFARVVESGSLSAAGRDLTLSPAAVGNHIRSLEGWLGARLLHRTTRRMALTEAGEIFLQRVRRILDETEEAKLAAMELQGTPRGILRITAPITFGMQKLGPVIADYLVANPQMQIDLTLSDRTVDLLQEGYDMAIRIGNLVDSTLIARRLADMPLILCASPAYIARHGEPKTPEDLAHHQCLVYTLRLPIGRWTFVSQSGERKAVDVAGRMRASNGELLRVAATKGLGLTLAPWYVVDDDIRADRLVPLLKDYHTEGPALFAVHPSRRQVSLKVRSFIDYLALHIPLLLQKKAQVS